MASMPTQTSLTDISVWRTAPARSFIIVCVTFVIAATYALSQHDYLSWTPRFSGHNVESSAGSSLILSNVTACSCSCSTSSVGVNSSVLLPNTTDAGANATNSSAAHADVDEPSPANARLKIALLFSGQPRHVAGKAALSFKTCLLDHYDVDTYAYFWWDNGNDHLAEGSLVSSAISPDSIDVFTQLYHPKAMELHPPIPIRNFVTHNYPNQYGFKLFGNRIAGNVLSMYAALKGVLGVWQNHSKGVKYDFVIRARSDAVMRNCPDLNNLPKGFLYGPDWHQHLPLMVNHVLIMAPDIAPAVMGVFDRVDALYNEGVFILDEALTFANLETSGLKPRTRLIPMQYFLPAFTRDGNLIEASECGAEDVPRVVPMPVDGYHLVEPQVSYTAQVQYRDTHVDWRNTGGPVEWK